jgi:pimeloyl-ACP methyl ester carboxylesterase
MPTRSSLASVLLLTFCLLANDGAAQGASINLAGYWQGTVKAAAGDVPVSVTFGAKENAWLGTMDCAAAGHMGRPLMNVQQDGARLHFEVQADTGVLPFDADIRDNTISGTLKFAADSLPFSLARSEPPKLPYELEDVGVVNGDIKLAGTFYLPLRGRPSPAVVFVAGLIPRESSVHFLADQLARNGIAVLTYDRRGLGKSTGAPRASFSELANDAVAAVELACARPEIDRSQVGVRGQSQGAWLGILAASRSKDVRFIIATGGGSVLPWQSEEYAIPARMRADGFSDDDIEAAKAYMHQMFEVARTGKGWEDLNATINGLRKSGSKWLGNYGYVPKSMEALKKSWDGDFSYDPMPGLLKTKVPFLGMLGEKDVYSPPQQSVDALRKGLSEAGNKDFTIKVIPGASHDFHVIQGGFPLLSDEYLRTMLTWVGEHVSLRESERHARYVKDNVIVSSQNPSMRIEVNSSLKFLGKLEFPLKSIIQVERYIFADVDPSQRVRRLFVAQFESKLPGNRGSYKIRITTPAKLGRHEYQQDVGLYDFAESAKANPRAEAERTKDYLEGQGLKIEGDMVSARFARAVGEDVKSEFILLYWESLREIGVSRADLVTDAKLRAKTFTDFKARIPQVFTVTDD